MLKWITVQCCGLILSPELKTRSSCLPQQSCILQFSVGKRLIIQHFLQILTLSPLHTYTVSVIFCSYHPGELYV